MWMWMWMWNSIKMCSVCMCADDADVSVCKKHKKSMFLHSSPYTFV